MRKLADNWIQTRQSLLSRLRHWDNHDSWEEFFNSYWKLIYRVALKSGLSDAEAQEVVQETVITVAKKMPEFSYDSKKGSFKGWLLRTTQWKITDQLRRRKDHLSLDAGGGDSSDDSEYPAIELEENSWERYWNESLLESAQARVKQRIDPREYQMFSLTVHRGLTPLEVARKLSVSRAHVYYARQKVTHLIRKELTRLERPEPLPKA